MTMAKYISHRCGMSDRCEFGCPLSQSDSKCTKYADRRECQKSMRQRARAAKNSRRYNKKHPDYLNW